MEGRGDLVWSNRPDVDGNGLVEGEETMREAKQTEERAQGSGESRAGGELPPARYKPPFNTVLPSPRPDSTYLLELMRELHPLEDRH